MERSTIRTARKTHRCDADLCNTTISPGERYRDYVIYPGHEFLPVDKPCHMRECATCADRGNRPIPA